MTKKKESRGKPISYSPLKNQFYNIKGWDFKKKLRKI